MNALGFFFLCLAVVEFLVAIVLSIWVSALKEKNEAQRKIIEAPPAEKPRRILPAKILVRCTDGEGSSHMETVFGNKFLYSEGRLAIADQNDLVGGAFAAGKWISAVVIDLEKKPILEGKGNFEKIPYRVEATQWFKNGDHPLDACETINDDEPYLTEGKIVRYFRRPDVQGHDLCPYCKKPMNDHGWIDGARNGGAECTVCPGDWVITGVNGEFYPCKPDIFAKTYKPVRE